jgi:hypothetical protein
MSCRKARCGLFYGAANQDETFGDGARFGADAQGNLRTIHSFSDLAQDGADPEANFTLGPDGFFYGTASHGGMPSPNRSGVVYCADTRGRVWVLHTFMGSDGALVAAVSVGTPCQGPTRRRRLSVFPYPGSVADPRGFMWCCTPEG